MLNWLSQVFQPRKLQTVFKPSPSSTAQTQPSTSPAILPVSLSSGPAPYAIPHLRAYEQSPWVYVAVNRIAEAAALVPLRVYDACDGERVEIPHHPLVRLLDHPNPFLSRFELIEQTLGLLELTGSAYWFLHPGRDGLPAEIWPLRPDRITIVPDERDHIRGYLYEVDGQRVPLLPVEVIHFRRWHPTNDFYGFSALEAARLALLSDRAMAEWNRNTFGQDNGIPAGIVSIHDPISDADFERLKREWRTSYGGTQRRTAFLRGGSLQWQSIGLSHTDLDFLEGRRAHRDEILNIFGIPVGLVSENATEANAKVAERLFIERTLYPKLVRLAQKISQDLLPFWDADSQLTVAFDDIRPTDIQAHLDQLRAAYPVLSINEIRARFYQLPAVAWGDRPPSGSASVTASGAAAIRSAATSSVVAAAHKNVVRQQQQQQQKTIAGMRNGASARSDTVVSYAATDDPSDTTAAATSSVVAAAHKNVVRRQQQQQQKTIAEMRNGASARSDTVVSHAATDDPSASNPQADELARWERFALNRLTRHPAKSQPRAFESHILPADLAFEIEAQLQALSAESKQTGQTPASARIRSVFSSARQRLSAHL